ncbi:MAG: LysM peptidoglycan-binding domain-containing protein [Candidatus Riflebacteria bacterium]|nr:LysM peptidoglycan-binding domain-containing protein [Candidatus Riflebacteria bacterium]
MFRKSLVVALLAVALLLPAPSVYAKNPFSGVMEWFKGKARSTTVTGVIDSVDGRKIMFKSTDGQLLELTGRKAEKLLEHRGATLRIFGNIRKPDAHYPTGGIDVRNFRVTEEAAPKAAEKVASAPEPAPEPEPAQLAPAPEPVPEPAPAPAPEVAPEPAPAPAPVAEPMSGSDSGDGDIAPGSKYVVQKGDTLAKISKKVYGTTKKWKKIADANHLKNPKALKVGMTLKIPKK